MSRAASKRKADSVEPLSAAVSASSSKAAPLQENERRMGDLNPFFTCRLCNGYFRDAMTISECLHTFCKICLHQHFQTDENQICGHCPICQCELGPDPMKGVRFNVALQSLFDKLLPQYAEEDLAFRNKLLASAAAQSSGAAASSSSASKGSDAAPPPISLPDASAAASSSSSSSSSSPSSAASVSAVTPSAALQAAGASKNILSLSTPHAREQITLELIPLPSYALWSKPSSLRKQIFIPSPPSHSLVLFSLYFISVWRRPSVRASVRAVRLPSRLPLRPTRRPHRRHHL